MKYQNSCKVGNYNHSQKSEKFATESNVESIYRKRVLLVKFRVHIIMPVKPIQCLHNFQDVLKKSVLADDLHSFSVFRFKHNLKESIPGSRQFPRCPECATEHATQRCSREYVTSPNAPRGVKSTHYVCIMCWISCRCYDYNRMSTFL